MRRNIFTTIVAFVIVILLHGKESSSVNALSESWCDKTARDCYFNLEVGYGLTMMYMRELMKAKNGSLYRYDVTDYKSAKKYSSDDVITADAYPEPKVIMSFNGTIPGPALHMYHGQRIHLRLKNKMSHETTSLHIHGVYQRGTPYSDGVPFVTQCPILPGQTFTQIFDANPSGTFFYHSHSGGQTDNGLFGAFIVHNKEPDLYDVSQLDPKAEVAKTHLQEAASEHALIFTDYNHDWDANMLTLKMNWGQYKSGVQYPPTKNLAGTSYSLFLVHSGLINGRGRFYDENGKHNGGPLSVFTVKPNTFHRFRLISNSNVHPFRISVDNHKLLVIASDGSDIEPVLVDSLVLHAGERFDFMILTNQNGGNFYIRGQTLEVGMNHRAEAILNYEGHTIDLEPKSKPLHEEKNCDPHKPSVVLNCPFSYFPREQCAVCVNFDQLKSRNSYPIELTSTSIFQEYFLNFAFPGYGPRPGTTNGRKYVPHSAPPLTQPGEHISKSCQGCGEDKLCDCPLIVNATRNAIVQLVFTNIGQGKGWDHPIHLHGHGFQVIKVVYPNYDKATGKYLSETGDIKCNGEYCNEAYWSDPSWNNGNIPGANLLRAPLKDVILIPSGGFAVVRFKADNPGLWIVHCHVGFHLEGGMAALVSEDKPNWPARPKDFPTCNSYLADEH